MNSFKKDFSQRKGRYVYFASLFNRIFCDRILLIENGTVVDYESHRNLMEKKESFY